MSDKKIKIEHIRGSGPGGQHKNKRMTGIRATHVPTGITVEATERRSQFQNKQRAFERLENRLVKFFHKKKPRVPTKKSKGADASRLKSKTKKSRTKELRKTVRHHEDG